MVKRRTALGSSPVYKWYLSLDKGENGLISNQIIEWRPSILYKWA